LTSSVSDFAIQIRNNADSANVGTPINFVATPTPSIIKTTWTTPAGADAGYNIRVIPTGSVSTAFYHFFSLTVSVRVGSTDSAILFQNYVDFLRTGKVIKYLYAR